MLPTFVGVGVPKAGTTWLHRVLDSHPKIWVPKKRKEVRYFTLNYHKGQAWYESFFPGPDEADRYDAVGEISPHYLYLDHARDNIEAAGTVERMIIMLRDPADRAYSNYKYRVGLHNYAGTFDDFVDENPEVVDWGFYARYLRLWFDRFGQDRFLVMIFEEAVADLPRTKAQLADFLGVDPSGFPEEVGRKRVNASYAPRYKAAYARARSLASRLRKWDLDWVVNLAMRFGAKQAFGRSEKQQVRTPYSAALRDRLVATYADDVAALEAMLGRSIDCWKKPANARADEAPAPPPRTSGISKNFNAASQR